MNYVSLVVGLLKVTKTMKDPGRQSVLQIPGGLKRNLLDLCTSKRVKRQNSQ